MSIIFPDWYDDLYQFECESKGVILNFEITVNGNTRTFNFYDPIRFIQDMEDEIDEIADIGYFKDEYAVVLKKVTKDNIIKYLLSI
ncbi:hypothetical protein [Gilliamella sp. BG6]|uniref:hypothetical protein n=1 Tax=unclassified Gilliamella TaxID=2685620 RepID=UPI003985D045